MAWYKVDDGFHSSHKVMALPRSVRLQAVGLWTLAGTWSASQELDGFIPAFMVSELGGTPRSVNALVAAGLWDKVKQDGYQYRNWAEYQPTRADLEAGRAKEAERKRKYREQQAAANGSTAPGDDRGVTEARSALGHGSVKARSISDRDRQSQVVGVAITSGGKGTSTDVPAGHQADSAWDTTRSPDTPTRPDPTRPLTTKTNQSSHVSETPAIDSTDPDLIHVSRYGIDIPAVVAKVEAVYGQTPNARALKQMADAVFGSAKNPKNPTAVLLTSVDRDGKEWRAALAGEQVKR